MKPYYEEKGVAIYHGDCRELVPYLTDAGSEQGEHFHPTQKPVSLMRWCLEESKAKNVIDPYMGSGPIIIAAKQLQIPAIGIEIEEKYCEIAAKRLSQEVFNFSENRAGGVAT